MGGSLAPVRVAGFRWNGWQPSAVYASIIWKGIIVTTGDPVHTKVGYWTVWWDSTIEGTLAQLRFEALPHKTGGALVGFVDHKIKTISIVLAMNAPEDSVSSPDGFIRGIAGVEDQVSECRRRTGQVVSYIGEWHFTRFLFAQFSKVFGDN